MSTIAEEINSQIDAGRESVERTLGELRKMDVRSLPPAAYVAAGLVFTGVAIGVGWLVYRSRRRRTLVQRLQEALPNTVRDLPAEVRSQVKRVRAL